LYVAGTPTECVELLEGLFHRNNSAYLLQLFGNLTKLAAVVLLAASGHRALGLILPVPRLGLSSLTGKLEIAKLPVASRRPATGTFV